MEVFRYSHNAWGQSVLEGVSWDLLGVFFTATLTFILIHALFMWLIAPRKSRTGDA
ncbi:MAG TPA: hypothetical protein QF517_04600 [Pseudomonadales bacterium]|nr:hypothetical protein [Pseudomonadales bacterium]MDP6315489.1 hypothetical protein [Pseudomonadales bacterium]MDP7315054.1 hypothetical protein [Pseudomonadales bacterium]HJL61216.1 hypothetical protein [Pseudomonadales bacterium]HJP50952.1 hypothetical protein [Pseudomonadales bacterium]